MPADPSSIDSCMVGGMVSNNSSGMCCGVSQNTYHTLKDMRVVFADGTLLDTADPASREAFLQASAAACSAPKLLCTHLRAQPWLRLSVSWGRLYVLVCYPVPPCIPLWSSL